MRSPPHSWAVRSAVQGRPLTLRCEAFAQRAERLVHDRAEAAFLAELSGKLQDHGAVQRGANDVIRFLAANGASLNVKNRQGRTPVDVAAGRREHATTAALLRQLIGMPPASAPAKDVGDQ